MDESLSHGSESAHREDGRPSWSAGIEVAGRVTRETWRWLALLSIVMFDFSASTHWRFELAFIAVILVLSVMHIFFQLTVETALLGNYDLALGLNRWRLWLPLFAGSLEGWILLEAGKYAEAEAATKRRCFDARGNPRLTSWQLYYHAMALSHQGKWNPAQDLLESAIQASKKVGVFHLGLADCLLEHDKHPEGALKLLYRLEAEPYPSLETGRGAEKRACRIGRQAWALARCSRSEEALQMLQNMFAKSAGFRPRTKAWLHYYAAETWLALGNSDKARSSAEEGFALFSQGQIRLCLQATMAKLDN